MKRIVMFLLILANLAVATPAAAAPKQPVGDQINIFFSGSTEFPEGTPFHIGQGFILSSDSDFIGIYEFQLEVDGVLREEDFVMHSVESGDPDLLTWLWVFNFPNGMTGTHTFTGHWLEPCQTAVDEGLFPGPCARPNEKAEVRSSTVTVTFVP